MKHMAKRILSFLCALVLILPLIPAPEHAHAATAVTEGLDLAKMQIVVPTSATTVENTAATELQTYIKKITGTTLSIKKEGSHSGAAIFIGATNYAKNNSVAYPTDGDENGEAWAIRVVGSNLVLCGAPTRGPLYAVYHLLEDVLGVHWWNPWEEDVPTGSAIVPNNYASSGVPTLEYREVFMGVWTRGDTAFRTRNRLNGSIIEYTDSVYGNSEYYAAPGHTHTFALYFPASIPAASSRDAWQKMVFVHGGDKNSNPEWYALDKNGNRTDKQLCLTNQSLKAEFSFRLQQSIAYAYTKNPAPSYFAVVPNDNNDFCCCTNCQNEIAQYGTSGYVLRFVNSLAASVKLAGYTDVILEMAAYSNYTEAPKGGVVPASNVQVRFAASGTDILHGINHANNAKILQNLKDWSAITTNNLYNWQYVVHYNNNGIVPSMFYYGDDFATMVANGVTGWFAEQEHCVNVDFWDMKLWLIMKLMENPVTGDEYAALMDEFIYGYYGEAAGKHIRDYLYYMNERAQATNVSQNFGASIIGAEWLTVQDIIKGNEYFEKAFASAGNDQTLLRRLRAARSGLDRVIVENYSRWQQEAASAGLTLPFSQRVVGARVHQTITEQIAWRGDYYNDEPNLASRYSSYVAATTPLPSELEGVAREHLYEYTTEDFRIGGGFDYNSIVDDSSSLMGTAYKVITNNISNSTTKKSMQQYIDLYAYVAEDGVSSPIGTLSARNVKTDGQYHLYSFDWTVPAYSGATGQGKGYIYIFSDWGLQIDAMIKDLQTWAGKTVRVYLSMKAEGRLSLNRLYDAVYYVDRVFVLLTPENPGHNYVPESLGNEDRCRHVCTVCGDVTLADHQWTEQQITVPHTATTNGQKEKSCQVCGKKEVEIIGAHATCYYADFSYNFDPTATTLGTYSGACVYGCGNTGKVNASADHIKIFRASDSFTLAYSSLFGDKVVSDSQSTVGSAVEYASYPRRNENTNWLILKNNVSFTVATTGSGEVLVDVKGTEFKANQGYQLYKFSFKNFSISNSCGSVYIFGDWGLQSSALANALKTYNGKDFDMYISMRIEGNVDGSNTSADSAANWPVYYIDYVMLIDACSFGAYTSDNNATCCSDGTLSASCTICGVKQYALDKGSATGAHDWDNGVVTVEPTTTTFGEKLFTCQYCGATEITYLDKIEVSRIPLPEELWEVDAAQHIRQYLAANTGTFSVNDVITRVEDSAAIDDWAVLRTDVDLDAVPISIWRIEANKYIQIGQLASHDIQFDGQYHYYKFSIYVPQWDLGSGNYVYFFGDWQCQIPSLANEMAQHQGKTVDLYLSMKVTGTANNADCYIDQVILAGRCEDYAQTTFDGKYHTTVCQKCDKLLGRTEGGIKYEFYAQDFTLAYAGDNVDKVVTEPGSAYGSAVRISFADRLAAYGKDDGRTTATIFGDGKNMEIQSVSGVSGLVGEITISQLRANQNDGQYHLYRFDDVELIKQANGSDFLYFFRCWGLQLSLKNVSKELEGKTVSIVMSMKIDGNVGADPVYYIDYFAITAPSQAHAECAYGNYTYNGDGTNMTPGTMTGTCVYGCGATHTVNADAVHATGFKVSESFVLKYPGDKFVYDPQSSVSAAVMYAASNNKYGNLVNKNVELCTNTDGVLATLPIGQLKPNQGYQIYKLTIDNVNVSSGSFVYIFDDWGLQSTALADKLREYNGKSVDVYLSLKITGDIRASQEDTANWPVFYLDRIMVVEHCSFSAYTSNQNATCIANGTMSRTCSVCGLVEHKVDPNAAPNGNHTWNSGVITVEPSATVQGEKLYTCTGCGAEKTEVLEKTPVHSWNLTLNGNIGANFHLDIIQSEIAKATVSVTVGQEQLDSIAASSLPLGEDGLPVLTVNVAAAQMTDPIVVTVTSGQSVASKTYTVVDYAATVLADANLAQYHQLVNYMLAYGTASQSYFNYRTDNAPAVNVQPVAVPADGGEVSVEGKISGLNFYGATLVFRNQIAVRLYFTGDITGVDFQNWKVDEKSGMYYVEVSNILPQDLEADVVVTATKGDESLTVAYAPMDYIIRMYNKDTSSAELKAVVQALYGYYVAAEALLSK